MAWLFRAGRNTTAAASSLPFRWILARQIPTLSTVWTGVHATPLRRSRPDSAGSNFSGARRSTTRPCLSCSCCMTWSLCRPTIGPGKPDSFPTRTAIAEPMNLSFNQQTQALADFNIPFYVERQPAGSNRITTNLKWAKARRPDRTARGGFPGRVADAHQKQSAYRRRKSHPNHCLLVLPGQYDAGSGKPAPRRLAGTVRPLHWGCTGPVT